ncbi:MAG: hypothetical protein IKV43_06040 [Clostridia bacterium]|nr:hypothetical protein [Clostridia bacterium]
MKERYINLMERALSAYTDEHILRYVAEVRENGVREHGFPRLPHSGKIHPHREDRDCENLTHT